MSENKIPFDEFVPPTLEELADQAKGYYRTCKPKVYRQARKDGDLQELCMLKAKAAKNYAEELISSGENPGPAWMQAIRSEILESETD
jgi:hypothetical protein